MKDVDDMILDNIENTFKSVKTISEELNIYYVRIAVRIRQLRKRKLVISMQSNEKHIRGVKPLKYKKR
jgi:predicted transcriptional regulator